MRPGPAAILSATGITHAFFGNRVLTDVAIEVHGGSIHALLGENGAGKSTLIGILSGGLKPDTGTIVVGGETHDRLTPALAQRLGIAVVHQELSLAPHLSVAENVALGRVPRRAGLIDYAAIAREVSAIFADLDAGRTACDAGRDASARNPSNWWRSPRRSTASRACSSWTSRPRR